MLHICRTLSPLFAAFRSSYTCFLPAGCVVNPGQSFSNTEVCAVFYAKNAMLSNLTFLPSATLKAASFFTKYGHNVLLRSPRTLPVSGAFTSRWADCPQGICDLISGRLSGRSGHGCFPSGVPPTHRAVMSFRSWAHPLFDL